MSEEAAPSLIEPTDSASAKQPAPAQSEARSASDGTDSAWTAVDVPARARLLDATRQTIGSSSTDLASAFAKSVGRTNDPLAIADGYLLGAAAAAGFARALGESLEGRARFTKSGPDELVKRSFLERASSPGVSIRVVRGDRAERIASRSGQTGAIVFSDAVAPSILLVLALKELFVDDRRPKIVAPRDLAPAVRAALAPLVSGGFATVEEGGIEVACALASSSPSDAVVAIASDASRDALRSAIGNGREVLGFSSNAPSVIAIVPFLYGRDELAILAEHVAAELTAPPAPTHGVAVIVGRDWLQRRLFLDLARAALQRRSGASQKSEEESLNVVDCECDEPEAFFDQMTLVLTALRETSKGASLHVLSLFAHPMLLERPVFAAALSAWKKRVDVPVVGIGTRASLAWTLGGPRVGPRGAPAQNGWLLEESSCITIEGPLRSRVPSGARALERRARFEVAPSLSNALYLGLRSTL